MNGHAIIERAGTSPACQCWKGRETREPATKAPTGGIGESIARIEEEEHGRPEMFPVIWMPKGNQSTHR